jgi:hypothetical protein
MRPLKSREKRILFYLAVALLIVGVDYVRRYWSPDIVQESEHYIIYSTATPEQTSEIALVAEIVYKGYAQLIKQAHDKNGLHPKLKIKLFKNRKEFKRCNRSKGWAEAYYGKPYCYLYYSADEKNPFHWMTHEATHQLNAEVADLSLSRWLNEGIAEYISTSRIIDNRLQLGEIDTNTYPIWWLDTMASTGNLAMDKGNLSIIPLRAIISGRGGPDIDEYFNLYYLHWWSLTHFLIHSQQEKHRSGLMRLAKQGGEPVAFEQIIGKIEEIEREWYQYVLELKRTLIKRKTPPVKLVRAMEYSGT